MDTWTVRYTETDGKATQLPHIGDEDEAKYTLDFVRRHIDPAAVLVDLAAEITARLPVGSRIRHTERGWGGTVVHDNPAHAPFPRVPGHIRIAHYVTSRYMAVCVRFDGRKSPEWFDAAFITPENGDQQ